MMLRAVLAIVGALAVTCVCCTKFSGDDGTTGDANEGGAPGTPCWPNGSCPTSLVCCLELDGSSRCTDLASCGSDHSHIECRKQADCTGGAHCCTDLATKVPADSGLSYLVLTNCLSRPCSGLSPERIVCTTNAECPAGKSCMPLGGPATFPDGKIFECE